jgi:hypothetical protein
MANNNKRSTPVLVIDICSTLDDHKESHLLPRSLSLLNYTEAYKDLSGIIHHSSLNRSKNFFFRSYSYPNNFFSDEKSIPFQPSSTTINFGMKLLDPYNGINSPADSSSRYSLYGSYFNLSENSYHPSLIKTENKLLAIDGRPLLIVDNPSKLSINTYQDKCNDWLRRLH